MADELTTPERDELIKLRALQLQGNTAETPVTDNGVTLPPSHWLHLANGQVIESNGVKSIHEGIQVIGSYEIPPEVTANSSHVF